MRFKNVLVAATAAASLALAGCASTSQATFYQNPKAVSKASLCRTLVETTDYRFAQSISAELVRRGIDPNSCAAMVQQQNQATAALVAVAVVGGAVAYCSNHSCGGGGYAPRYPGNCYSYYDRAADGSLCGNRSALSRPGGW